MPCHMCRWVSTKPGITIVRDASITSAFGALMFGRTAEILLAFDQHVGLLEVADRRGRARARSRP